MNSSLMVALDALGTMESEDEAGGWKVDDGHLW
jgi:hypothetical protein